MKSIKELSEDELKKIVPEGFFNALHADPKDVFYCMKCDGLRLKDHDCVSPIKNSDGTVTE